MTVAQSLVKTPLSFACVPRVLPDPFRNPYSVSIGRCSQVPGSWGRKVQLRPICAIRGTTENSQDVSKSSKKTFDQGIRVNKCFKSFASRRESDAFIENGRVTINGEKAFPGARVQEGDIVKLDDRIVDWQRLTVDVEDDDFVYIKHWKKLDVECTTDENIPNSIMNSMKCFTESHDRIFPVGRLDQASTGLILLTSDGRLPNAVLGAKNSCEKTYLVHPDVKVSDDDIRRLRDGVVITTYAERDGRERKQRNSRTLSCHVERADGLQLFITLREGRNRQIRKMLGALGYTTRAIHRVSFMGITLDGLAGPGDSCLLNEKEMDKVRKEISNTIRT